MNLLKLGILTALLVLVSNSLKSQGKTNTAAAVKGKQESKLTEVITTDSLPSSEILARAVNWVKLETPQYQKSNGVTAGGKAECTVKFSIKPKELNPQCDYTGHIMMKVIVEAKESRYRYTVNQIEHVSKSGKTSGGSIDNVLPDCGSMIMDQSQWKKLKGEAIKNAMVVIGDLKEAMKKGSKDLGDEW